MQATLPGGAGAGRTSLHSHKRLQTVLQLVTRAHTAPAMTMTAMMILIAVIVMRRLLIIISLQVLICRTTLARLISICKQNRN